MDLAAFAVRTELATIARDHPELHRTARRYPAPVQLALAALEDVRGVLREPSRVALISVAPTEGGSPELHGWVQQIGDAARAGRPPPRMNPTHTLHVVDNLALSVASITLGNGEPGHGLGGGPGQAWEALVLARELLDDGAAEVVVLAADQVDAGVVSPACGLAIVLVGTPARTLPAAPGFAGPDNGACSLAAWLEALA